jgi:hypothetical protein
MATKDISRYLLQPRKHYAAARLQQGRILLDSDFNDGAELADEEQRQAVLDLIGPAGSGDAGFSIGQPFPVGSPPPAQTLDLRSREEVDTASVVLAGQATIIHPVTVRAGALYLGGLRFDQDQAESIAFQRDYLQLTPADMPAIPDPTNPTAINLYYLHAWEQAVGAGEDVEIGETMLEGPDTSVRVRHMRRVQVFDVLNTVPNGSGITSDEDAFTALVNQVFVPDNATFNGETSALESNGRLQLVFKAGQSEDTCGPCEPSQLRYLGDENVALRLMQTDTTHYVWSLHNATPTFRVTVDGLDTADATTLTITMLTPPQSEAELPLVNQVIELLPFGALLDSGDLPPQTRTPHARKVAAEVGAFTRAVSSYDGDTQSFTVDFSPNATRFRQAVGDFVRSWDPAHPDAALLNDPGQPQGTTAFYMRLWHVATQTEDVELTVSADPDGPALADTGVVPVFHAGGRRGDFWIATLRVDRPGVIVPFDLGTSAAGVAPHGPRRFIQRLALVQLDMETVQPPAPAPPQLAPVVRETSDTRPRIRRVTDDTCVTATVGDGVNSIGDYLSIQAAIHALPSGGGRIAVHPGLYHEEIQIVGRRNISIEGCGDATVIETPAFSAAELVIVSQSSGITLSGLTLNPLDQRALLVTDSSDVSIGDVAATSGVVAGDKFSPGARVSAIPLVDIERSSSVTLRGLILEGFQRPALVIQGCEVVTLEGISALGSQTEGVDPTQPLISLISSALVKMSDSRLAAFGQVALDVSGARTQDVTLSDLTIDVGAFTPIDGNVDALETRAAIDIEAGDRIRLERCRITMEPSPSDHAAVVVNGSDVVIIRNRIEATLDPAHLENLAWGGLQLRGGSARVQVLKNHIVGGVGHGITLGSVLWRPNSSPVRSPKGPPRETAIRREGAGRGQMAPPTGPIPASGLDPKVVLNADIGAGFADEDGQDFSPVNEGAISDLTIADNRIEGARSNGISAITVLGLRNFGGDLIEIERARIERNVIVDNVQAPGASLPFTTELFPFPASREGVGIPLSALPFGGIVLGAASGGIDIRDNVIARNGTSATVPTSGIFILTGDAVSITGNRINDNGALALAPASTSPPDHTNDLLPGVRAGIAVMLAGVTGDALDQVSPVLSGRILPDAAGSSLRVIGNTVTQNEGRALHVVATGPVTVDGNFLLSRGYHGAETVNDRFAIGDVVFIENLGAPWEQFDIGALSPRDTTDTGRDTEFKDFLAPRGTQRFLLNQSPTGPRFFAGEGGAILFSNNQVTYDWTVVRLPPPSSVAQLSFFPVALLGLDHVGCSGNQLGLRLDVSRFTAQALSRLRALASVSAKELILSHLFVIGTTVEVTHNRCASGFTTTEDAAVGDDVVLSIMTFAETLSSLALNQTTLPVVSFTARTPSSVLDKTFTTDSDTATVGVTDREQEGNLVLLHKDLTTALPDLKRLQEAFMKLLSTGSLSDSNDLVIDLIFPTGSIHEGDVVTLIGRNFGVSLGQEAIFIGSARVPDANIDHIRSTDLRLVFTVPFNLHLPTAGDDRVITVSNGSSLDRRVATFIPFNPVQGTLILSWIDVSPQPLLAGEPLSFLFSAQTENTTISADYALVADINQPWPTAFTNTDGTDLPDGNFLTLGTNEQQNFILKVTPPAATEAETTFLIGVSATAGFVEGTTGLLQFTIGEDAPVTDPGLELDFVTQDSAGPTGLLNVSTSTISALLAGGVTLMFNVIIGAGVDDTFLATADQLTGTQGWSVNVDVSTFSGAGTTSSLAFTVGIEPGVASPSQSGFVSLTLKNQRTGAAQVRTFAVRLVTALPQ